MYSGMVAGSVIVDLAAESGGNVEGSVAGEVIETAAGVRIWGGKDVPSQLPFHASSLYSKNLVNLMGLMIKSGEADSRATIALDFEDEIIAASAVTHAGEIRNEQARAHIQGENAGKSS
jgi:NAD(P) transhydrogenase subunit alpha